MSTWRVPEFARFRSIQDHWLPCLFLACILYGPTVALGQEADRDATSEELPPPQSASSDAALPATQSILEVEVNPDSDDADGAKQPKPASPKAAFSGEVPQLLDVPSSAPPPSPQPIAPSETLAAKPSEEVFEAVVDVSDLTEGSAQGNPAQELYDAPDIEILMRSPIHEAFGMPTAADVANSELLVAPKAPPEPLHELPPQPAPAGKNIEFISGYWDWDDERGDYIWISGMYREIPPGRAWVTTSYVPYEEGIVRVPGYWAAANQVASANYLPAPPAESPALGPTTPPPSDTSFWLTGEWVYQENQFQWRPGYWTTQYDNWIWQPSCYLNTPRGYVYVSGYWDYEPSVRGIPYASVYFPAPVYRRPAYRYRPLYPIARSANLLLHLFVRSGRRHYYYGDYYDARYSSVGYRPWYRTGRAHYDTCTLLGYYQWKYRNSGFSFVDQMLGFDSYYRTTPAARPIRTVQVPARVNLAAIPRIDPSFVLPTSQFGSTFDAIVRSGARGQRPEIRSTDAPRISLDAFRNPPAALSIGGSQPRSSREILESRLESGARQRSTLTPSTQATGRQSSRTITPDQLARLLRNQSLNTPSTSTRLSEALRQRANSIRNATRGDRSSSVTLPSTTIPSSTISRSDGRATVRIPDLRLPDTRIPAYRPPANGFDFGRAGQVTVQPPRSSRSSRGTRANPPSASRRSSVSGLSGTSKDPNRQPLSPSISGRDVLSRIPNNSGLSRGRSPAYSPSTPSISGLRSSGRPAVSTRMRSNNSVRSNQPSIATTPSLRSSPSPRSGLPSLRSSSIPSRTSRSATPSIRSSTPPSTSSRASGMRSRATTPSSSSRTRAGSSRAGSRDR